MARQNTKYLSRPKHCYAITYVISEEVSGAVTHVIPTWHILLTRWNDLLLKLKLTNLANYSLAS